ncbi:MAG: hypothetical protein HQK52_22400 [Oligoflexia bacterium]|nr:hypothetical protein [Oligoflexia bacterium]
MIAFLSGEVEIIDQETIILKLASGIGYQIIFKADVDLSDIHALFISEIYKDNGNELYGHRTLQEKKLFSLLMKIKGIGSKSAYAIVSHLDLQMIVNALITGRSDVFKAVPGIGGKTASQMMYAINNESRLRKAFQELLLIEGSPLKEESNSSPYFIIQEAVSACKELGFDERVVLPIAQELQAQSTLVEANGSNRIVTSGQMVSKILKRLQS